MKYRPRIAENKIKNFAANSKVVLVTGARQAGKSTLLKHSFPDHKTVVFDIYTDLYGARKDPDLFLNNFPAPLILDEIQNAPELTSAIKRRVDLEHPDLVVQIEIIDEIAGVSLLRPDDVLSITKLQDASMRS